MTLDLTAASITHLHANSHIDFGTTEEADMAYNSLASIQRTWPKKPVDLLGAYVADRKRWYNIHLSLLTVRNRELHLEIVIWPLAAKGVGKRRAQLEAECQTILKILDALGHLERLVHSRVTWEFPAKTKRPIVSLPMITLTLANAPFDEIVGVRLSKKTEGGNLDVIMEIQKPERLLRVHIGFSTRIKISPSMFEQVSAKGNAILETFVIPEPLKEGETL